MHHQEAHCQQAHAESIDHSPSGIVRRGDTALFVDLVATDEAHLVTAIDGSVAGVFVPTYRDLAVGDDVRLVIAMPDGDLEAQGRVRWRREATDDAPPGVGVEITQIDDDGAAAMARFAEEDGGWYYDDVG